MKASFTSAATSTPPSAAMRRARGKVVTYKEARDEGAAELCAAMEKLLDPIEQNPDSHATVAAYGDGPLTYFEKWTHDLGKFIAGLPQSGALPRSALQTIETMGLARVEMTREINLYLGALPEALRRYNEEYIPEFTASANHSGDPEDELLVNDTLRRKDELVDRTVLLEHTRLLCITAAQFLRQVVDAPDLKWAHDHFAQVIRPGLEKWRQQRAGGDDFSRMHCAEHQPEVVQGDIKIRKPLRFKQASGGHSGGC